MTWAHATNCRNRFQEAVSSPSVSAIECDVLLDASIPPQPILAHPPHRDSDLTAESMLKLILMPSGSRKILRKHLKLDFKEIDAVGPTLDLISNANFDNDFNKEIYLNADILPGPGFDVNDPSIVPATVFFDTCLSYVGHLRSKTPKCLFGFSLGFKCDWKAEEGYSSSQVIQMSTLLHDYRSAMRNLGVRIILALNARQLVKSLPVFDDFLTRYPESSILAWTGSGEPEIPSNEVETIQHYYEAKGVSNRIEFDCCIQVENTPMGTR